ncbi:MAG: tRNA (adenosine(37)-N6)-threonylcarbamoyltransferase complex dimerization subunit type 1 TsaB [Planctomycetia bacterium]|nr:tRNA (adenosine(37)-N6)-threonylcarbamoyltransferase complex dimerization subunit type 1 TsaB [Planctomycetia bacterium]
MNRSSGKLLAIETTDMQGSIAFCENGHLIIERKLPVGQRSAQSLVPSIHSALAQLNWKTTEINCVAVAIGPGSFTGLRVGLTTAKIIAWAIQAKIVGVNVLQSIAAGVPVANDDFVVSAAMDAQRNEVVVQHFLIRNHSPSIPIAIEKNFQILSVKDWLQNKNKIKLSEVKVWENNTENNFFSFVDLLSPERNIDSEVDCYLCGPVLKRWKNIVSETQNKFWLPAAYWFPSASQIAKIAWDRFSKNDFDDIWKIKPIYSRRSAAEEKMDLIKS